MKTRLPYADMKRLADALVERLRPACERIEVAGSIRRKKSEVGDIEIIAIPKPILDLLGEPTAQTEVDTMLGAWPIQLTKNGQKYKQFTFAGNSGNLYQVDLFLQPDPATWGVNFMIRTGCGDFSKRMVTAKEYGGLCPPGLSVKDGRVWRNGVALDTPEEKDVFALWGIEYIQPEHRTN